MSSDDSGGFLSKVARLVRRPGAGWADSGPGSAGGLSDRQALKEAIERKKRNDFVRKREFDMLRAIRRREQGAREQIARPSFFQSSQPSHGDGRELTIRKIDEIEAQMSTHWWQQKPGDESHAPERLQAPATRTPAGAGGPAHLQAQAFDTTSDWGGTIQGPQLTTQPATDDQWPAAPRRARRLDAATSLPVTFGDEGASLDGGVAETPTAWAGLARQLCREVPALEAAAVHFINDDDAQAEKLLRDAVQQAGAGDGRALALSILLDFYRATDRRADYEACLDTWTQAGVAAKALPAWQALGDGGDPRGASGADLPVWVCPPQFDAKALASLQSYADATGATRVLDWSVLSSADPDSAAKLQALLEGWAQEPLVLHWVGHANLRRRLQASTPSGRRENHAIWWTLRLAVLRLMGRNDEFDLTALDYCVTYGVTPPDWVSPQGASEMHEAWPPHAEDAQAGASSVLRLRDRLRGDLGGVLAALEQQAADAEVLRIDCGQLRRVDLVAAGALLQWATALKGRHRRVVLERVHRLLAVALHVVGVDEALQLRVSSEG